MRRANKRREEQKTTRSPECNVGTSVSATRDRELKRPLERRISQRFGDGSQQHALVNGRLSAANGKRRQAVCSKWEFAPRTDLCSYPKAYAHRLSSQMRLSASALPRRCRELAQTRCFRRTSQCPARGSV
eukprot:6214276-Pleurochrysis_carterae.AAC.2